MPIINDPDAAARATTAQINVTKKAFEELTDEAKKAFLQWAGVTKKVTDLVSLLFGFRFVVFRSRPS